jgi:hypothetical protein
VVLTSLAERKADTGIIAASEEAQEAQGRLTVAEFCSRLRRLYKPRFQDKVIVREASWIA